PVSPPSLSSTFTDPPPTAPYTLSLHDALPIFDRRDRQHLLHPLHDRALRLRAAPRFQPRHRLQGAVVRGAVVVGPPARGQRQPQVVPRDVDVLGNPGAICDGWCSIRGPTTLVARDRLPLHLGAMQ